jgi:hypothetical protein
MMKNGLKVLSLILSLGTIMFFASCSDDDESIIPDDDDDGLLVANGFYPVLEGEDPVAVHQMTPATVDAPDFGSMERSGFVQLYAYLTAGNYNMVEVDDGEIVNTYGGSLSTIQGEDGTGENGVTRNMECDPENSSFSLVSVAVDGPTFTIPTSGLYVMAYDAQTSELVFDQLETAGVIGAVTPGGWGADTGMSSTIGASGAVFEITNLPLEEGEWKVRFNCRWAIDRRIDPSQPFDNANGYSFFTNFGGSLDALQPGNDGPNINNGERGQYTVSIIKWL